MTLDSLADSELRRRLLQRGVPPWTTEELIVGRRRHQRRAYKAIMAILRW